MNRKRQIVITILVLLFSLLMIKNSMAQTAIVSTDTLKLRKEASTDSTVLELLNEGQKLEVIEQSGDWVKVKVNKMTGFVHKDYIKMEQKEENTNTVVQVTQNEIQNTITTTPENTINQNTIVNEENSTTKPENTDKQNFVIREEVIKVDSDVFILPVINAIKITGLEKGTKVTIMDEVKNWMYVQTEEVSGWMRKSALESVATNTNPSTGNGVNNSNSNTNEPTTPNTPNTSNGVEETPIEEKVMYVNSPSIYVRKGPSTKEEAVDSLILNAQVTVIAESGDWYKVKIGELEGYIAKRLLSSKKQETTSRSAEERIESEVLGQVVEQETTEPTPSKGEEIVAYAKQYLGAKYVYGGSGPSTFDCSGFTMYVYEHFGIHLSHSATAQSKNGSYIAKENLQPGDLVFFKDYETMNGIGHCGIYIGEGNFIHASSGTGYCVKISTLLTGSYLARYETARRII